MGPIIAPRDGKPVFSIGAAGGSTIITTVVQTLINHVDLGMSMPAALAAPRVPGDATALQILGDGRMEAVAEPVRLFGGSALTVHPSAAATDRTTVR